MNYFCDISYSTVSVVVTQARSYTVAYMIGQIFFGLLLVAFGVSCVRWNYKVANTLSELDFLAKIGGGDVYNGTKVLGIVSILLGITVGLGLWQGLLSGFLTIFFGDRLGQ